MADISGVFTKAAFRKDRGLYGAGPAIAYPQTPGGSDLAATHMVPFSEESIAKAIEHLKTQPLVGSGQGLPQGIISLTDAGGLGGPLTWNGWQRLILCAMGYENPHDSPKFIGTSISPVNVSDATNASPIVVTTTTHGYTTGDGVRVASVGGNTAANGDWIVTVINATSFSLDGSTGNGAYTTGGTATKYEEFGHLFELDEALQDQAWAANELDGYTPPSANDRKIRRGMLGFKKATDYVHASCFVNKMTITGSSSEIKISLDLIGNDVVMGSYNSANWTLPVGSNALALFQQAIVKVGTRAGGAGALTEYGVSGWELTVNNNLKGDDQSTVTAPKIVQPLRNGPREITLKLDFPRYNTAIDTLQDYAALNTELAASIALTGPNINVHAYETKFFMSSLRMKNPTASIGGGGVMTSSLEFEAARPGGSDIFDVGGIYYSGDVDIMKDSELVVVIQDEFPKNYLLET